MSANPKPRNDGATATEKPERITKLQVPLEERVALTPREFAGVFGKAQTWAYRQIYAGRVQVIESLGSIMIPRSELDRITKSASTYQTEATR
jgi:hypothetical protein